MNMLQLAALLSLYCASTDRSTDQVAPSGKHSSADRPPALTIYNQNFAVVREILPLTLTAGTNSVDFDGMTRQAEPDSVILRDPSGGHPLQILEQNYRNDELTLERMLDLYLGETIDFLKFASEGEKGTVKGKIIRSGFVPARVNPNGRYGYAPPQQALIEVDGSLRFQLPGMPLFPGRKADTILVPTMRWLIETDRADVFDAELAYVTGGMSWDADYNIVAPEQGSELDLIGWVTIDNRTGKTFQEARIKLIAGDVNKIQPASRDMLESSSYAGHAVGARMAPPVSEKSFDEYHLYNIRRPTTLHDAETKQVEFVRAGGVRAERIYVYEGTFKARARGTGWNIDPDYGAESNTKVWVMREFENSEANRLGIALPAGRMRFYLRDDDGQLEFTGENQIDHTPKDELVRVYTGNSFDLVGERKQTQFRSEPSHWFEESFEIRLRNHKKENVEIRVVEHLFRWTNWQVLSSSLPFEKKDAQKIEFKVPVPADGEVVLSYKVHYSVYSSDTTPK